MLLNSIQTNLYAKACRIKQLDENGGIHSTNPLKSDTFIPSILFKGISSIEIFNYAALNNTQGVKQEIAKGVDVNQQIGTGATPLCVASFRNCVEVVKELLNCPDIDVNVVMVVQDTALTLASYKGHGRVVKELLKHPDLDVNIPNGNGATPLILAAKGCWQNVVEELLKHPDIDVNSKDKYNKTASDYAIEKGCLHVAQMIKDYVPGVDRREGVIESVGVKMLPVDINKLSPEENIWSGEKISNKFLSLVKAKNYNDALKMLEVTPLIDLDGNNKEVLRKVIASGEPDFVESVFDYKFHKQQQMQIDYDIRRKEFLENTIQTLSYDELKNNNVALNTVDGFKILMGKSEFNPNDKYEDMSLFERACKLDPEGNLAKQILNKYEDVNTVKAVKTSKKAIRDLINEYESTGKYKTLLNKIKDNTTREETRKLAAQQLTDLIESGNFNPAMTDSNGNTVLHIAAALPEDSARMLIVKSMEKGVDINAENIVGGRPLMSAIMKLAITKDEEGRRSMLSNIRFLLDKGADVDAQDQIGQTALHFACSTTIPILLTMLLSKKPNVFIEDKHGNRAAKYLKTDEMKDIYSEYVNRL